LTLIEPLIRTLPNWMRQPSVVERNHLKQHPNSGDDRQPGNGTNDGEQEACLALPERPGNDGYAPGHDRNDEPLNDWPVDEENRRYREYQRDQDQAGGIHVRITIPGCVIGRQ
jgi:hypothetical protein